MIRWVNTAQENAGMVDLVNNPGKGQFLVHEAENGEVQPPLIETDGDWFSIIFRRKGMGEAIDPGRRNFTSSEMNDGSKWGSK